MQDVVGRTPTGPKGVPGVFVIMGVTVDVGEGVSVGVDVLVGIAIAVSVKPDANVPTAKVCTSSTLRVGVASASLGPHAPSKKLPINVTVAKA